MWLTGMADISTATLCTGGGHCDRLATVLCPTGSVVRRLPEDSCTSELELVGKVTEYSRWVS